MSKLSVYAIVISVRLMLLWYHRNFSLGLSNGKASVRVLLDILYISMLNHRRCIYTMTHFIRHVRFVCTLAIVQLLLFYVVCKFETIHFETVTSNTLPVRLVVKRSLT